MKRTTYIHNYLHTSYTYIELLKMESSAIKIKLESNEEPKIENGLKEMENMDFTIASCSSNLRNNRKSESSSVRETQRKIAKML